MTPRVLKTMYQDDTGRLCIEYGGKAHVRPCALDITAQPVNIVKIPGHTYLLVTKRAMA